MHLKVVMELDHCGKKWGISGSSKAYQWIKNRKNLLRNLGGNIEHVNKYRENDAIRYR